MPTKTDNNYQNPETGTNAAVDNADEKTQKTETEKTGEDEQRKFTQEDMDRVVKKRLQAAEAKHQEAVDAAVEDLISATAFIIENAEELNIDPDNIVTMGSSAGAMTVLSADYELCNRTEMVSSLPAGFRFKGVIPFAGALFRDDGRPSYKENPAPTLFLHGKDDKVVPYKGFSLFRYSLWGSDKLAGLFAKKGYPYWIIRYNNHGHEVSSAMVEAWQYVSSFIEDEIMAGNHRIVDTSVTDDSFKRWESQSTADLYK